MSPLLTFAFFVLLAAAASGWALLDARRNRQKALGPASDRDFRSLAVAATAPDDLGRLAPTLSRQRQPDGRSLSFLGRVDRSVGKKAVMLRLTFAAYVPANEGTFNPGALTVRADAGFYNWDLINRLTRLDVAWSITVNLNPSIGKAIAAIAEDAWVDIVYPTAEQPRSPRPPM